MKRFLILKLIIFKIFLLYIIYFFDSIISFLLYVSLCNSFTSTHILAVCNQKEKRIANFSERRTRYTLIKLYPSRTPYSPYVFQKQYFFQPARAPKRTDLVKWTLAERHSPWRNPMGATRNELYTRCLTWEGNQTRQNGTLKGMLPSVPSFPPLPPYSPARSVTSYSLSHSRKCLRRWVGSALVDSARNIYVYTRMYSS